MEEQQEIWKDIVIEKNGVIYDYTGLYQVSNMGGVRSLNYNKSGIIKTLSLTQRKGYNIVSLSKNGEKTIFTVHRLVATMFIPNPYNYPVVNHKDENKANNMVDNLEWCTVQYNTQYSSYKIRDSKIGKPRSNETKMKTSMSMKGKMAGEKHPLYGKPRTEEEKKKISDSLTGKKQSEETKQKRSISMSGNKNPKARAIICLETLQVFTTIKEAKEWVGSGNIKANLSGKTKYGGKHPETGELLHWMYYEDYLKLQKEENGSDVK